MSNVIRFRSRADRDLEAFRLRTIERLRPRLEAIAREKEQASLVSQVCARANHPSDVFASSEQVPHLNDSGLAGP